MYNGKQRDVAHSGAEPVTDHMYPGNLSDIDLWLFLSPGDQNRPCIPDHYSKAKKEQAQEKDALAGPSLGISADTPSRKDTGYDQPETLKPSRHFSARAAAARPSVELLAASISWEIAKPTSSIRNTPPAVHR